MNLDIDYRHIHVVRSPQTVPLLVLIKEWGRYQKDAYSRTDIIFLILRGIQPLASFQHGLEIKDILDAIEDVEFKSIFTKSFDGVLRDLKMFMDLFDNLRNLLHSSGNPGTATFVPHLLDVDCSNSIIGIYVRQCVLEYKKLTFSQLMRFHSDLQKYFKLGEDSFFMDTPQDSTQVGETEELKELDFTAKLKGLLQWWEEKKFLKEPSTALPKAAPGRTELGSEALLLAELHGKFGHNKEGLYALEEAIRLAQQNNHSLLLEHALAWLLKLESFDAKDSLVILKTFVKNADDLKVPLLGLWGRLQEVKTLISLSEAPKTVLQTLLTCEMDRLSNRQQEKWKSALHITALSLLATTWEYYGHRLLALHYAQVVCHMTSCDLLSQSAEEQEGVALAIVIIAKHLQQTGNMDKSLLLLKYSIARLKKTGLPFKILSKFEQELKFDRALNVGDFSSVGIHLNNIQTLDKEEGHFRTAVLAGRKGQFHEAMENLHDMMKSKSEISPELYSRCLQLLAGLNSDLGLVSTSLPHIVECLAVCRKHHFSSHRTNLTLCRILLQFGSPMECLDILKDNCLQILSNGSVEERGIMHSLMAQATLIQVKEKSPLTKESILSVVPLVARAVADLRECSSNGHLRDTLILQAHLYNAIGYSTERDKALNHIQELRSACT